MATLTAKSKKSAGTIQSVSRASRILLAVVGSKEGMAAKQVAELFDLTLPTAYHLLTTLVEEGLLVKDQRRTYTVGPKASVIADAVSRDVNPWPRHLQALERLAEATRESAHLTALRQGKIRVLATVEGAHAVRVGKLETGFFGDVHARASGKLLLAFADESTRATVLKPGRLKKLTPNTISTHAGLLREFDRIRHEGVSYDEQEFELGVACLSVPVFSGGEVVAALTVSAPVDRLHVNREAYVQTALRVAAEASD